MAPRTLHGRRLTATVLGATTAFTLTACAGGSDDPADAKAPATPATEGAVTRARAAKIVDHYVAVNNKANATQDEKLLSTVESGQVHAQSKADHATFKTWPKEEQKDYEASFAYENREYYIPADEDWFAMKATASGSKDPALLVFARVAGAWKLISAVYSDSGIPAIDTDDHGFATAVSPTTRTGTLAPDDISAAFEDLYATGGKKAGSALSRTSAPAKDALKLYKERNDGGLSAYAISAYFANAPTYRTTYALRLADGGVIAVVPTSHTEETLLKEQYRGAFQITPNKRQSVYAPTKRALITDTYQSMLLATLPASGKPAVIAKEYRMTDSK